MKQSACASVSTPKCVWVCVCVCGCVGVGVRVQILREERERGMRQDFKKRTLCCHGRKEGERRDNRLLVYMSVCLGERECKCECEREKERERERKRMKQLATKSVKPFFFYKETWPKVIFITVHCCRQNSRFKSPRLELEPSG